MKTFNISNLHIPIEDSGKAYQEILKSICEIDKEVEKYIFESTQSADYSYSLINSKEFDFSTKDEIINSVNFLYNNIKHLILFPNEDLFEKLRTIGLDEEQFKWFIKFEDLKNIIEGFRTPKRENDFFIYINPIFVFNIVLPHLSFKFLDSICRKYLDATKQKGNQKTKHNFLTDHLLATKRIKPLNQRKTPPRSNKAKEKLNDREIYDFMISLFKSINTDNYFDINFEKMTEGKTEKMLIAKLIEELSTGVIITNPHIKDISKATFVLKLAPLFILICPGLILTEEDFHNTYNNTLSLKYKKTKKQPYDSYEKYLYHTITGKMASHKK